MSKLFSAKTTLRNTLFVVTVLGFATFFSYPHSTSSTVYAAPTNTPAPAASTTAAASPTGSSTAASDSTNCAVEKIGWILCPILDGTSKATDKVFQFLADHFLVIDAELLTTNNNGNSRVGGTGNTCQASSTGSSGQASSGQCNFAGTYNAWKQALNLANIMFIIAFVVIVLSQVTSMGLSNYGIKRMLPRLIIAAIAVNVSYYICQAMVDLSNILGYEIMHALQQLADQVGPSAISNSSTSTSASGNGILNKIVIGILGAAALVWLLVGPTAAIILFILVTALTVVIILLLRKAFIILLVVASPFAFVAYLLPNTEQFFQKWLSMFWKLLMVFPVVALLMGGGQLASAIILAAGSTDCGTSCDTVAATTDSVNTACSSSATAALPTGNGNTATPSNNTCEATVNGYGTSGEGAVGIGNNRKVGWTLGLVATGVAVAPLLAVWSVLQGAISAAGAIGGKMTAAVRSGTQRGLSGAASAGKAGFDKTAMGRGMAARRQIKQNYRDQRFAERMSSDSTRGKLTRTAARGISGNLGALANKADIGAINKMTGGIRAQDSKLTANFAGAADKIRAQEVKDAESIMRNGPDPFTAAEAKLEEAIRHGDEVGAKAAQNILMSSGGPGMSAFIDKMKGIESDRTIKMDPGLTNALKQNAMQNHSGAMKEKGAIANTWASSGYGMGQVSSGAAGNPFAGLNDEQIAKQTSSSLKAGLDNGWITQETADRITTGSVGENLSQTSRAALDRHAAPLRAQRAAAQNNNTPPPNPPTPPPTQP